jgi:hypothetical protein
MIIRSRLGCGLFFAAVVVLWPGTGFAGNFKVAQAGGAPVVDTGSNDQTAKAQKHAPVSEKQPTAAEAAATDALYQHLQDDQIKVRKDTLGSRLVWTDTVIVEIADRMPPEPLRHFLELLDSDGGTLADWVHNTFETHLQEWQPAKRVAHPKKAGTDEITNMSGTVHCYVNPIYLDYILARYPNASVLMKSQTDPVIFTEHGQICAILAPWTKLPDGTPLS